MKILHGNCMTKIKELDDNSIDCVVSSPPYFGLRDYGVEGQFGLEHTYQEYLANTVKLFAEMRPKLKDTATIWWNVGDSYASKPTGNVGKSYKQKSNYGSYDNFKRLDKSLDIKEKNLMMIPNRVAIALQDAGWYIRSEIVWHKPNPMPESIKDRPTSAHEKIWLITKSKNYYYDADAIKEPLAPNTYLRYHQQKHLIDEQEGSYVAHAGAKNNGPMKPVVSGDERNKRNVWTVTTKPFKGAHFATFPKDLIEPCILAGCPEGGVVLDPFGGSGTTAIVAEAHRRKAILIELNPEYIKLAEDRLELELGSLLL